MLITLIDVIVLEFLWIREASISELVLLGTFVQCVLESKSKSTTPPPLSLSLEQFSLISAIYTLLNLYSGKSPQTVSPLEPV